MYIYPANVVVYKEQRHYASKWDILFLKHRGIEVSLLCIVPQNKTVYCILKNQGDVKCDAAHISAWRELFSAWWNVVSNGEECSALDQPLHSEIMNRRYLRYDMMHMRSFIDQKYNSHRRNRNLRFTEQPPFRQPDTLMRLCVCTVLIGNFPRRRENLQNLMEKLNNDLPFHFVHLLLLFLPSHKYRFLFPYQPICEHNLLHCYFYCS